MSGIPPTKSDRDQSTALREYLEVHKERFPSVKAFVEASGLSESTVKRILMGHHSLKIDKRAAIFAITGLPEFAPTGSKVAVATAGPTSRSLAKPKMTPQMREPLARIQSSVEEIRDALTDLTTERDALRLLEQHSGKEMSAEQHVARVRHILNALDQELGYFKALDHEGARELLRTRIDARDVGYIIALLRALYSKEAFDNWILASSYSVK